MLRIATVLLVLAACVLGSLPATAQPPVSYSVGPAHVGSVTYSVGAYGYKETLRRVMAGDRLTLSVGATGNSDGHVDALPGVSPGVYDCYLAGGMAVMELWPSVAVGSHPDPKASGPVTSPAPSATRATLAPSVATRPRPQAERGSFAGIFPTGSMSMNARSVVPGGITNHKCDSGG